MKYVRTLFSPTGLVIAVYIVVGVFVNTASPHIPSQAHLGTSFMHSWVQYAVSVLLWPLSFWHPAFTVAKWSG